MTAAPVDPNLEVDVGIVTYRTAALTVEAIAHLRAAFPAGRVLVLDNASGDGTARAIRQAHPDVEVEESPTNRGFAAGMNHLIGRSRTPWFLALNPDAWPEVGAIETLVSSARAHPGAAAVAPLLLRPDGSLEHSTNPFPSLAVAAVCALGGYQRLWPAYAERNLLPGAWQHDEARRVDWAVGAALLMRRRAIEEIGGFDERFFMYAEDLEWCWRAQQAGWEIRFEPGAVVRHVGNASGSQVYGRARTTAHLHNTYRFYRRHHGPLATATYRLANIAGCARLYVLARMKRDDLARGRWADHLRAHLGRVSTADGPPA